MKVTTSQSVSIIVLTAALLSGCGSSGVTANPSAVSQGLNNNEGILPNDDGATGAYPLTFKTVGGSAPVASVPLNTDSLLKVKVTLNPATHNENTPVYTNFTANYSCATVAVTLQVNHGTDANPNYVNIATQVTGRVTAAGSSGCYGSAGYEILDFSMYLTPGHGKVKILAQALTSNFNCVASQQYPYNYPFNYYHNNCEGTPPPNLMMSIYQYHVVNGKLDVQVNGTSFGTSPADGRG